MSNTMVTYESMGFEDNSYNMSVTAFIRRGIDSRSVQFTIDDVYCSLNEVQVRDLIDVLSKRLRCEVQRTAYDK